MAAELNDCGDLGAVVGIQENECLLTGPRGKGRDCPIWCRTGATVGDVSP